MPPIFWSKIFVESQDISFDVVEAVHKGIVPAMGEQIERNLVNLEPVYAPIHLANSTSDFQALIEKVKN